VRAVDIIRKNPLEFDFGRVNIASERLAPSFALTLTGEACIKFFPAFAIRCPIAAPP